MEIRARYLTIGLFTLAVIAAGFLFVYWLYNSGGIGGRSYYRVYFLGPVAGLNVGSPVTFNGVRVGEVNGIAIADPARVEVLVGVVPDTPMRADTKVALDFQGLTGAAAVALSGGSATAALLKSNGSDRLPFLTADANASQSMTGAARNALLKLDTMLTDNAEPLKSTIGNLQSFTDALARNSDKVDGILAGLERMTGSAAKKGGATVVDLSAPKGLTVVEKPPAGQIAVPEPTALGALDSDKLTLDPSAGADASPASWTDALPKLMQARLVQSFENAGLSGSVIRGDGTSSDYTLQTDLRTFRIAPDPTPEAELELGAKLVNAKGRVVAGRLFASKVPLAAKDAKLAAAALNEAFGHATADLIGWTVGVVSALPPPKPEDGSSPSEPPAAPAP